jgi:AcrR family transcriptional regulator
MSTRRAAAVRRPARPRGDLRSGILRAARRLCFTHGPDGVTARAVARAVGVSPTAIYLHFRGLDDLLDHLRMEGHELLASYLQGVDSALPPAERVRGMGRAYHRFGTEHPRYFDLMFQGRSASRRRDAVQREMFTLLLLRDVVQAGIATGAFRRDLDPMVATNALWAEVHGVTALHAAGLLVETSAGHADEVLDAVLDGALRWLAPPSAEQR